MKAIADVLFYQLWEWFQGYAVDKSRQNISSQRDIRSNYAKERAENSSLYNLPVIGSVSDSFDKFNYGHTSLFNIALENVA